MKAQAAQVKYAGAAAPAQAPVQAAPAPAVAKKETDWQVECAHHAKGATRPIFEKGTKIEVVPDKGKTTETVKIVYKNEASAPPPSLELDGQLVATGKDAGKDTKSYAIEAAFRGDLDNKRFWLTKFWRDWRDVTVYRVKNAPLPVEIRVRSPRRYKIELKFPALKKSTTGRKYTNDVKLQGGPHLAPEHKETKQVIEKWSSTKLGTNETTKKEIRDETSTGHTYRYPKDETKAKSTSGPIVFSVDGIETQIDVLDAIAKFKEVVDSWQKIIDTIRDFTPRVGWYFEHEFQFLQGTFAAEWYWKEDHDHTAFEYLDLNIKMMVASLKLELGIGVSVGFEAQIFASITGSVGLEVSGRRERPVGPRELVIPVRGQIVGAVGARFKAGNLFKAEATGQTGVELRVEFGFNRRDREPFFTIDGIGEWTGLEVTVVASGGLYGVGGKVGMWKKRFAEPVKMFDLKWPSGSTYAPPVVSRDRIRQVILTELTRGLNAKIATAVRDGWYRSNDYMKLDAVADELMATLDAHGRFSKAPRMVDGLAKAIRADLDKIAADSGKDYVVASQFEEYRANKLPPRLDAMVPPSDALVQAAKAAS